VEGIIYKRRLKLFQYTSKITLQCTAAVARERSELTVLETQ
jgi:hypothetical protein